MGSSFLHGDTRLVLGSLPPESVQGVATSPPYFQQRSYKSPPQLWGGGWEGELGQEPSVSQYVAHTVEWMRAVRRVLREDGSVLLNLGDTYNAYNANRGPSRSLSARADPHRYPARRGLTDPSLKNKDLLGVPWRVALALQADGWYLRGDYIWRKLSPTPERVKDRCSRSHEYIFHLTRSARYFWNKEEMLKLSGANAQSVWDIPRAATRSSHPAPFPDDLALLMVKAISLPGQTVLDPFGGSHTTARAAEALGRNCISIDIN